MISKVILAVAVNQIDILKMSTKYLNAQSNIPVIFDLSEWS